MVAVRHLQANDIDDVVALQRACFPPPFSEELLWQRPHLIRHSEVFPEGQFVAVDGAKIIASANACKISEENWTAHCSWTETVGGPYIERHDPAGTTLYGLDISVHPLYRGRGVGRTLYAVRSDLVRAQGLIRYGTACRVPGYLQWSLDQHEPTVERYVNEVASGKILDRTLTPLLRYGLRFLSVIHEYMDDEESANSAALLEWMP